MGRMRTATDCCKLIPQPPPVGCSTPPPGALSPPIICNPPGIAVIAYAGASLELLSAILAQITTTPCAPGSAPPLPTPKCPGSSLPQGIASSIGPGAPGMSNVVVQKGTPYLQDTDYCLRVQVRCAGVPGTERTDVFCFSAPCGT